MIYFILIILLLSTLAILESLGKNLIPYGTGLVVFLILFLFAGSRPIGVDHDSVTYMGMFALFSTPQDYFTNLRIWGLFEPFYYLIPSVLKYVLNITSYGIVTLYIYAFLGCAIIMIAVRKLTQYFYVAILTLFCNYYILQQMTQIRAAIAVGIFLYCINLKVNKQWGAFAACVCVSFLFHYSSLLALTILFLSDKDINKPLYLSLAVLSLLLSFVDFSWILNLFKFDAGTLAQKQELYVNEIPDAVLNRRSYIYLIHLTSTISLICYAGRIYAYNKYIYLMLKIQVIGLLFFQILSASPAISSRSADYFLATHIITLSASLYLFKYRFWPALGLCVLNISIFFTLIFRNQLLDLEYYAFLH